jgi:gamma-glutamylaminecyclotransferase
MHNLFVYGSLKRGCHNHRQLAGQKFLGRARTAPGFRLYDLGDYPGMVCRADDLEGVEGEVWSIDAERLQSLDAFEGVADGPYRRAQVPLVAPFDHHFVEAYIYVHSVAGRREIGAIWQG